MKKLCLVATIPAVVHAFLREQIQAASASYDVTIVCNASDQHLLDGLSAKLVLLPIERKPSVRKDVVALLLLWRLFRRERFDILVQAFQVAECLHIAVAGALQLPARYVHVADARLKQSHCYSPAIRDL